MRKSVLTLAVLAAAALPNLAVAGDAAQENPPATPTQMSDAELDSVAAGSAVFKNLRNGHFLAINNQRAVEALSHNKNFQCVQGSC